MTTSELEESYSVDFRKSYIEANEILASSEVITGFPIDVKALLAEQSDIVLCSFERAEGYGVDIRQFGSESAVLMEMNGAYIIFYNQDESRRRIRYSITHEYGHYVLGHRMNLNKKDPLYDVQEVEANFFAAQLLMPEQLLRACSQRGIEVSPRFIRKSFSVSKEAAKKRMHTIDNTVYGWRSRQERECDDIILAKYGKFLDVIAPKTPDNLAHRNETEG